MKSLHPDQVSSMLFDLYDIRNALSSRIKARPKDQEGTEFTIGDCLDDVISILETIDNQGGE